MRMADVELDGGVVLKCRIPPELAIHVKDICVAESNHTLEYGHIGKLYEEPDGSADHKLMPAVIRRATLQDQSRARENGIYLKMVIETCRRKIKERKLEMQVINVRHSFDRKVVTITYTAEEHIQFRDVARELGEEFHARVEFRQVGVRDAAGMIGGMGPCGRNMCCCSWLNKFEAVSVRMAKNQGLSPNPNTISGVCGRLKCCLRYEDDCYVDLARFLPRDGSPVVTTEGDGVVVDKDILRQTVRVRLTEGRIAEYPVDEITQRGGQ